MKLFPLIVILLFVLSCSQFAPKPVIETPPTVVPTPIIHADSGPAGESDSKQSERLKIVEDAKMQFLRSSISITVSGAQSDVINMESAKLSTPQIVRIVRPRLKDFASAGFTAVNIADAKGEKQTIPVNADSLR